MFECITHHAACDAECRPFNRANSQITPIFQGVLWFIDGTVLTVTTGRDGTVKPSSKWNRGPVPSRRQFHPPLTHTVRSRQENSSRCTLPSRPVEAISPYRPVPSPRPNPTVPSRRQNLPIPSRPAVNTATPICTTVVQIKRARLENASRTTHPETHL